MSDRLEELRRLRALQREQLESIEREILELESAQPESAALEDGGDEPPLISALPGQGIDEKAEAILREYARPSASIEKQTKYGCFLYLGLALALLALALAAVYFHARAAGAH